MRTARALTVSPSMLCVLGGVYLVPGGVPGAGGCTWSGGGGCTWSRGVYCSWGVYLVWGGVPGPGVGGVPGPEGVHLAKREKIKQRDIPLGILPWNSLRIASCSSRWIDI